MDIIIGFLQTSHKKLQKLAVSRTGLPQGKRRTGEAAAEDCNGAKHCTSLKWKNRKNRELQTGLHNFHPYKHSGANEHIFTSFQRVFTSKQFNFYL